LTELRRVRIDRHGLIFQTARGQMERIFIPRAKISSLKADTPAYLRNMCSDHPQLKQMFDPHYNLAARVSIADQEVECLSQPLRVFYSIEPRCNLTCSFCAPRDLHNDFTPGSPEMEEFLLKQIANSGSFQVQLTGGEIFIRGRQLFPVLQRTDELGLATMLATNGVWHAIKDKKSFVRELAEFKHIIEIKVSIDGDPSFHDSVRGSGNYAEAKSTLVALAGTGIPTRINTTIFKASCKTEQIEHLANLAKEVNSGLQVIPVRESGRAKCMSQLEVPGAEELYRYTMRAKELREKLGVRISFNFDIFGGGKLLPHYDPDRPFSCSAGLWGFGVNHTGETNPCGFAIEAGEPGTFMCGVITPQTSLLDIWLNSPVLWKWRNAGKSEECRTCSDYLSTCWGGCMVQAYLTHGKLNAPDPYCLRGFKKRNSGHDS